MRQKLRHKPDVNHQMSALSFAAVGVESLRSPRTGAAEDAIRFVMQGPQTRSGLPPRDQ
jgi:hypothetical protein